MELKGDLKQHYIGIAGRARDVNLEKRGFQET